MMTVKLFYEFLCSKISQAKDRFIVPPLSMLVDYGFRVPGICWSLIRQSLGQRQGTVPGLPNNFHWIQVMGETV